MNVEKIDWFVSNVYINIKNKLNIYYTECHQNCQKKSELHRI